MTYGVRYPTLAFITGGVGEANDGIPPQPFETFCYDSALNRKLQRYSLYLCFTERNLWQHRAG